MDRFVYYDGTRSVTPHWVEGVVVPLSKAASCAKFALDQTKHAVVAKIQREEVRYTEVDLNRVDSLLRSIMHAKALRWAWEGELDRVVIGRDMWHQVVDHYAKYEIGFSRGMHLGCNGAAKIVGINVQVLPNIEGYLLLPKFRPIVEA